MRVVFFGTPSFAVATLRRLLESSHEVIAVVTQPDRPRGRGHHRTPSPVKTHAETNRLPVLQPTRLKDPVFREALAAHAPDVAVVAAYGRLLPDELLALPAHGMLNVHASLLPKYRGAAPVHRAVMAGETETGVTIIRLVREMDAGPMLARASLPIAPNETSEAVERELAALGADLLVRTVDALEAGRSTEQEQDHAQATLAPRLSKADGVIDWSVPATTVHNQVRGLHPWPHAYTYLDDRRYVIHRTTPGLASTTGDASALPGQILEAAGDRLAVSAGEGTVVDILEIQPEGRRPLAVREFLAGHRLVVGARFHTPSS